MSFWRKVFINICLTMTAHMKMAEMLKITQRACQARNWCCFYHETTSRCTQNYTININMEHSDTHMDRHPGWSAITKLGLRVLPLWRVFSCYCPSTHVNGISEYTCSPWFPWKWNVDVSFQNKIACELFSKSCTFKCSEHRGDVNGAKMYYN